MKLDLTGLFSADWWRTPLPPRQVGFAVGPALAALLITHGGYTALFYQGIACYLITLFLLLPLALKQGATA